jgi:hypothetical protein
LGLKLSLKQEINFHCGRHFGYDSRETKLKITETNKSVKIAESVFLYQHENVKKGNVVFRSNGMGDYNGIFILKGYKFRKLLPQE